MIYKATKLISRAMDDSKIKYTVEEYEKSSEVQARFSVEGGPSVNMRFISRDDDNDVSIRIYRLINEIPESKVPAVIVAANQCNNDYRFLKFVVDEDRDLNVEFDIPLRTKDDSVGPECCEIFIRSMKILDKVYPTFMRALWS